MNKHEQDQALAPVIRTRLADIGNSVKSIGVWRRTWPKASVYLSYEDRNWLRHILSELQSLLVEADHNASDEKEGP